MTTTDENITPTAQRLAKASYGVKRPDRYQRQAATVIHAPVDLLRDTGWITNSQHSAAIRYRRDFEVGHGGQGVTARYGEQAGGVMRGARQFYTSEFRHMAMQSYAAATAYLAGADKQYLLARVAYAVILELPMIGLDKLSTWAEVGAWISPGKDNRQLTNSGKAAAKFTCERLEAHYDRIRRTEGGPADVRMVADGLFRQFVAL